MCAFLKGGGGGLGEFYMNEVLAGLPGYATASLRYLFVKISTPHVPNHKPAEMYEEKKRKGKENNALT